MSRIASYERPLSLALTYSVSALHLCCSLYFGRLLWRRREIMPIRGRLVRVVLLTSVLTNLWSWTFSLLVQLEEDMSCEALFVTFFTYAFMVGALYLIRCLVIVFKYQLTERRMRAFDEQAGERVGHRRQHDDRDSFRASVLVVRREREAPGTPLHISVVHGGDDEHKVSSSSVRLPSSHDAGPHRTSLVVPGARGGGLHGSMEETAAMIVAEDRRGSGNVNNGSRRSSGNVNSSSRRGSGGASGLDSHSKRAATPTELPMVALGSMDKDDHVVTEISMRRMSNIGASQVHRRHEAAMRSIAESDCWFVRNQWLIHSRTLRVLFASWCVFWWMVMALFLIHSPAPAVDQLPNQRELCRWPAATQLTMVVLGVTICAMLVFAVRLRAVVEGFHIKSELKMTALTYLVTMALWRLLLGRRDRVPTSVLTWQIGVFVATMINIGYPLYWSYVTESSVSELHPSGGSHSRRCLTTLQQVLDDTEAKELFRVWLFREFADENLMFLDVVNAWLDEGHQSRHAHEPQLLLDEASAVIEKFFVPNAEFEVCMPSGISDALRKFNPKAKDAKDARRRLKYITERLLDARETTLELLGTDPFLRFKAMCEPLRELQKRRQAALQNAARMDAFASINHGD
eukprot:TRINITY_DN62964_c0_g3_i1.p1 TRINITY_DN62964_c0_g3~~TRINITY_DN62964_c0_g3_i1.p1  ORF type:complete len:630 (-),score=222.70 TRINITY_DN62964_c0_g3_i1:196-2085(-)